PFEYFHPDAVDGITCLPRAGGNFPEDLEKVLARGTTPNGVFGVKTHWNGFRCFINKAKKTEPYKTMAAPEIIGSIFPNVHYIRLRRKDILRQAVSLAKAQQSRIFSVPATQPHVNKKPLKYDYFKLCDLRESLVQDEAAWQDYFRKYSIKPLEIFYEDMVAGYEETLKRALDFLRIEAAPGSPLPEPPLKQLSDEVNDAWYGRYKHTPVIFGKFYSAWRSSRKGLGQFLDAAGVGTFVRGRFQ
ncbi:MAG: Stf0 family sulfotransferase, partial [Candidatus Omnitrophota bacterium]